MTDPCLRSRVPEAKGNIMCVYTNTPIARKNEDVHVDTWMHIATGFTQSTNNHTTNKNRVQLHMHQKHPWTCEYAKQKAFSA